MLISQFGSKMLEIKFNTTFHLPLTALFAGIHRLDSFDPDPRSLLEVLFCCVVVLLVRGADRSPVPGLGWVRGPGAGSLPAGRCLLQSPLEMSRCKI